MRWTCPNFLRSVKFSLPYLTPTLRMRKCYGFLSFCNRSSSSHLENERLAEKVHAQFVKNSFCGSQFEANHLLDLYVRFPWLFPLALRLFDDIPNPNVRTWTILISSYSKKGDFVTALVMFSRMQKEGTFPNCFTLATSLKCCSNMRKLKIGKEIHGWILKNNRCLDVVLQNAILDMYMKCAALDSGSTFFKLMESKDIVSWNVMIRGYLSSGEVEKAIDVFDVLELKDACTWNTLIDGLIRNGFEIQALDMVQLMLKSGTEINDITLSIILNLASCLLDLQLGKQAHVCILKAETMNDPFIGTSLIDMYCKCKKMDSAFAVLRNLYMDDYSHNPSAESVLWSSVISGYLRNNEFENAIQLFRSMVISKNYREKFTLTSILSACGKIGNLAFGRQIHGIIQKIGHKLDDHMCSSLIDMYSKCGYLDDALMIFHLYNNQNVVLWTSIICGCAANGKGVEAIKFFNSMMLKNIKPNGVTFVGVLTACSRAGMVEEGLKRFNLMQEVYGIKPMVDHYTSMVDIYGRAGRLNEAKAFILMHNLSQVVTVLKSLLTFCRLFKDLAMEKWVSERLNGVQNRAYSFVTSNNLSNNSEARKPVALGNTLMVPGQSWIHLNDRPNTPA